MTQRIYAKTSASQQALTDAFPQHKMDAYDLYSLFLDEVSVEGAPVLRPQPSAGNLSDEQFERWLLDTPCAIVNPKAAMDEPALFDASPFSNVYVARHPNFFRDDVHAHAFFSMFYVFRGQCSLALEVGDVVLGPGDFLVIAPETSYTVESDADNFIVDISARRSDFEDVFRAEQSRTNPLSLFFRRILFDRTTRGYVLFHTGNDEELTYSLKNVAVESAVRDEYSFMLAHCWLSILLSNVVRKHYQSMEAVPPIFDGRVSGILTYIQQHYRQVTLDELCEQFGYSKSYLCTLLKRNTGKTFSELVNMQRVNAAATLLHEGRYSVEETAHRVGYKSVDYFSRQFKRAYGVAPSVYKVGVRREA